MTLLSRLLSLFPTVAITLTGLSLLRLCLANSVLEIILWLSLLLFSLYGFPLFVYRLHNRFYPVIKGISYLQGDDYSPWWGAHQIQLVYIAFPMLETILRLIPGAFSAWLRLWGAKVGQQVYWAPGLEIADRGLLEVGDHAIIGHQVGLYAHVIKPKRQDLMLYINPIKIGAGAFIGSASRLGPGVVIAAGDWVPVTSDLFPNQQNPQPSPQASETPCETSSSVAG